jgi:hypothetical protein
VLDEVSAAILGGVAAENVEVSSRQGTKEYRVKKTHRPACQLN